MPMKGWLTSLGRVAGGGLFLVTVPEVRGWQARAKASPEAGGLRIRIQSVENQSKGWTLGKTL